MSVNNLTQTQFQATLTNFDAVTQSEIVAYLQGVGIYTTPGSTAQQTGTTPIVSNTPPVQIAEFSSNGPTTATSTATVNAIIPTGTNANYTLNGSTNILAAVGGGINILVDQGTGNDELIASAGVNSLYHTGSGNDTRSLEAQGTASTSMPEAWGQTRF